MSGFVKGIKTLINGPDTSAADSAAAQAQQQADQAKQEQQVQLSRQQQTLQDQQTEQAARMGKAARTPPGRRLLLAATGEQGVTDKLGG